MINMNKIIVASKNPVKVRATEQGFRKMFPDETFEIEALSVPSGISNQPLSDKETFRGAFNRMENASRLVPDAEYWLGIEGGIVEQNGQMAAFAWITVRHKNGLIGKSRSGTFFLPGRVAKLIRAGTELGTANDLIFKRENSKQDSGAIGILTGDVIDRTMLYEHAVILALVPFKNREIYLE